MNDTDKNALLDFDDWTLFEVGSQAFGLPAKAVVRAITVSSVFPLPYAPEHVAGMTQVDGDVLPCMNLARLVPGEARHGGNDSEEAVVIQWQDRRAVVMVSRTLRQIVLNAESREQLTALDGLDDNSQQAIVGELTNGGQTVLLLNPAVLVAFSAQRKAGEGRSGFFVEASDNADSDDSVASENLLLYVTVAGQHFALPVADCREIISLDSVTPLPASNAAICGLTLLRGRSILVVDPAEVLGLRDARRQAAVVVNYQSQEVIFAVDGIDAVRAVANHHIRPIDEGSTLTRAVVEVPEEPVRAVLAADRIIGQISQLQQFMPSTAAERQTIEEEDTEAFLVLRWSNERFAIPLDAVLRIEGLSSMRPLNTEQICGFISSEGEVLPVMRGEYFYGMAGDSDRAEGYVILQHGQQSFAVPVSETENICHVPVSHIQRHQGNRDNRFTGSIRLEGDLVTLVSLEPSAQASAQVESPS